MNLYTEEFKNKVKEVYPNCEWLHNAIERGSECVGQFLYNNLNGYLPALVVLSATSLDELKERARIEQDKLELYNEWRNLFGDSLLYDVW